MNLKELEGLAEKPVKGKEPSIFFNDDVYTDQDWAEVRMANETKKYNPEGEKIRQKIIERLKNE